MVALPRPFVYTIAPEDKTREQCALIFYDNAGEHFQPGVNIVEQPGAQHVASAALVEQCANQFERDALAARDGLIQYYDDALS